MGAGVLGLASFSSDIGDLGCIDRREALLLVVLLEGLEEFSGVIGCGEVGLELEEALVEDAFTEEGAGIDFGR